MKRFTLILCCVWGSLGIYAQSDFKKYREQQRNRFEEYRQQRRSEFEEYRRKRNKEFANYLEKNWKEIDVHKGMVAPALPKPFVPKPDREKPDVKPVPKELPIKRVTPAPPVTPPIKPVKIDTPTPPAEDNRMDISFYGSRYKVRSAKQCKFSLPGVNPADIAAGWRKIDAKQLDPLIYDCQQIREQLRLCDYTYYQFVKQVTTTALTPQKTNEATLLTGYILAQSGIDFRFALQGPLLKLALAFDVTVYRTSYYVINGRKYYLMDCDHSTKVRIMQDAYSPKAGICRLAYSTPMRLPAVLSEKRPLISKKYPGMKVDITTNKSLLEAYTQYPRMDWAVYANTPLDETTANKILPVFRNAIAGKSEEEAVNMILNFVQTAFVYGYDDKIWGEDRTFFADETLFYPYSDCEDRAILFSQLIRRLTGQDVVLLHYPNHLATAVRFRRDFPGDYVMVDGRKYMVCDPTGYKPIGNAYDEFKNVKAEVIKLNNKNK